MLGITPAIVLRTTVRLRRAAAVGLAFLLATPARSAETSCRPGETSLSCRLHSVLNLLSVTAAVLGALLVLALIAAVWYYRRNRNKDLLPR